MPSASFPLEPLILRIILRQVLSRSLSTSEYSQWQAPSAACVLPPPTHYTSVKIITLGKGAKMECASLRRSALCSLMNCRLRPQLLAFCSMLTSPFYQPSTHQTPNPPRQQSAAAHACSYWIAATITSTAAGARRDTDTNAAPRCYVHPLSSTP